MHWGIIFSTGAASLSSLNCQIQSCVFKKHNLPSDVFYVFLNIQFSTRKSGKGCFITGIGRIMISFSWSIIIKWKLLKKLPFVLKNTSKWLIFKSSEYQKRKNIFSKKYCFRYFLAFSMSCITHNEAETRSRFTHFESQHMPRKYRDSPLSKQFSSHSN